MQNKFKAVAGSLSIALLLSACATTTAVSVPDTHPGDQLQSEYMHGNWCTNREETSVRNQAANFSAMTNVSKQFWQLTSSGEWQISSSGWLYEGHGSWKLEGRDTLQLTKAGGNERRYRTSFANGGKDMVLEAEAGDFLVMERCD